MKNKSKYKHKSSFFQFIFVWHLFEKQVKYLWKFVNSIIKSNFFLCCWNFTFAFFQFLHVNKCIQWGQISLTIEDYNVVRSTQNRFLLVLLFNKNYKKKNCLYCQKFKNLLKLKTKNTNSRVLSCFVYFTCMSCIRKRRPLFFSNIHIHSTTRTVKSYSWKTFFFFIDKITLRCFYISTIY